MTITVRIGGPNAESLAEEVEVFLSAAFDETTTRQVEAADADQRRDDPVAMAALLLSIPGALLAALELAERAKLAERVSRLRRRLAESLSAEDRVELRVDDEPAVDLARDGTDTVMDLLAKHGRR